MSLIYSHTSQNFDERSPQKLLDLIIIHYTGMEKVSEALNRLCDPSTKVSAHYLIDRQGNTYQLVDDQKRAWHAGISYWQGIRDINGISIGIELDNPGHDFGMPLFPESQINSLLKLLRVLSHKYHIKKDRILGHSDIAPLRKIDPGEAFPWFVLHNHGFGMWPETSPTNKALESLLEIQQALLNIGYECPLTGILDHQTVAVIQAFQRHFIPEEITGTITEKFKYTLSCLPMSKI